MKFRNKEWLVVKSAVFFPSLKRGHRRMNCKDCNGNHFQNPMEQAAKWLEQNG